MGLSKTWGIILAGKEVKLPISLCDQLADNFRPSGFVNMVDDLLLLRTIGPKMEVLRATTLEFSSPDDPSFTSISDTLLDIIVRGVLRKELGIETRRIF